MKKKSITNEQLLMLKGRVEEWQSVFLSTETIDKERAERAISALYEKMNLPRPEFIFFSSPIPAYVIMIASYTLPVLTDRYSRDFFREAASKNQILRAGDYLSHRLFILLQNSFIHMNPDKLYYESLNRILPYAKTPLSALMSVRSSLKHALWNSFSDYRWKPDCEHQEESLWKMLGPYVESSPLRSSAVFNIESIKAALPTALNDFLNCALDGTVMNKSEPSDEHVSSMVYHEFHKILGIGSRGLNAESVELIKEAL